MDAETAVWMTGRPDPPGEPLELKAGPLAVRYENGRIRYIKSAGVEIVRMIYPAVRDPNWGTVEPVIREEKIEKLPDSFQIRFHADYQRDDIFFEAVYSILGSPEGIRFVMRGIARCAFRKNRIGFCVLHPVKECAGRVCVVRHPDGSTTKSGFPSTIDPLQPFKNIRSMSWRPASQIRAELIFTGDVFETEDQRNWTDASYKTYCTPLDLPFPAPVHAGQVFEQIVELKVRGAARNQSGSAPAFRISGHKMNVPRFGVGASYLKRELDAGSVSALKGLNFHHYRFDLRLGDANWPSDAAREFANAARLNAKAEVALHVDPDDATAFPACVKALETEADRIFSFVVFNAVKKSTDGGLLTRIAPVLRSAFPDALIGAGTDCYFAELNRQRPPTDLVDFLSFSVNPQVHAFDDPSLIETLEAQSDVVESARRFANGKAIHVSPVTFRMRFNPDATGSGSGPAPGELPATVDPRQMSLFGAAWTLGSIKHLAEAGAACLTYFETVGWRGLMQGDTDSGLPGRFNAVKGQIFPVWQVFKWVGEFQDGMVVPITSSHPLRVDGLLLQRNGRRRLIVANYTLMPQILTLPETASHLSVLDERSVRGFSRSPASLTRVEFRRNRLSLLPYAVACIDY
jgi:D-apionolactonase